MASSTVEEFWGCTLGKDKKEIVWDPQEESEEDVEHKLQLTTACLGFKAKDGERNLVEVTTEDNNGKKISCPIVALRVGAKECVHLDLGFFNATKFTLKEGSGPLSLSGVHLQAEPVDYEDGSDESEDEDVPELVEPTTKKTAPKPKVEEKLKEQKEPQNKVAKRPAVDEQKENKSAKKKKVESKVAPPPVEVDSEDDEEEYEDSEDEEMPSLLDGEAEEDSGEEDSEEGDDEPEGDDVEDDDSDDATDDEEEESEEEEELPVKKPTQKVKTPKLNGLSSKNKKNNVKDIKTPAEKKTPGKKDSKTPQAKKTPDEIKQMLLKSPNLPKKFDKFSNFMKNNLKVVDEKTQKEFWDYVQKNKK